METLFLTVVLGLVAALQAQDPLSFTSEEQDLTGTWYVKAIVTDWEVPEGKRPSKMSPVTVTALEGGDLEATFTVMKEGQCHQKKVLMQKTEEPGKYSTCRSPDVNPDALEEFKKFIRCKGFLEDNIFIPTWM
ncbi:PREDICTED: odorant-binding protein 2a-like, partial [Galeopterus variegatus]|uniref:Odorant-binding protein 2a-like n=1 Tax=Galeopterus variegatus TaxID=482537 RepID=A0ABM0Q4R6_GALVR